MVQRVFLTAILRAADKEGFYKAMGIRRSKAAVFYSAVDGAEGKARRLRE